MRLVPLVLVALLIPPAFADAEGVRAPTVAVTTTRVAYGEGRLEAVAVQRAVAAELKPVKTCYETRLNKVPDLAGEMLALVRFDAKGKVVDVTVAGLNDSFVEKCLANALRKIKMREPIGAPAVATVGIIVTDRPDQIPSPKGNTVDGPAPVSKWWVEPRVKYGKPKVVGSFDASALQKTIEKQEQDLEDCYALETAAERDRVMVEMAIDTDGRVRAVAADAKDRAELALCIELVFKGLQFPRPGGGVVRVSYPLEFETVVRGD